METALAIYEALLQANVPPPAARRVAEALEKDMTSTLATKQDLLALATREDLLLLKQDFHSIKQDLHRVEQVTSTRIEALESRMSLMVQNLESRLLVKLGALITILFGAAGAVQAFLR